MKKIMNSNIFYKYINNKTKLIPFNPKVNNTGEVKYAPSVFKEWRNTVYFYNSNFIKNLPNYEINLNKLIKAYFNLYFYNKAIINKYISYKSKRLSLNKIYVSRAEIKHTNSKAIITLYTYNREKISLLKKIRTLKKSFLIQTLKIILFLNMNVFNFKNKISSIDMIKRLYLDTLRPVLYKELLFIRKLKLRFNLNKYKFEEKFLFKLSNLISKFFKKKIEFNIINLKSIIMNTDIFTEILTLKIKKKRANVVKMMNIILAKAIIPEGNRIQERGSFTKSVNFSLLENKYKNLNVNSIIHKNNFDKILNELYNNINISDTNNLYLKKEKNYTNIKNIIFNIIKYKNLGGIRLEIKGRLTKRYRADRAIFKVKWKGGLKNIDSSFKGLSTVKLRGFLNSNVEYSIRSSKRRIGAFAVKGWISGK